MENEGADWIELIDNLDDIFFHDQTIKHFNLIGNKQNNENENTGDVDDQYISYEEFLSRTKPYDKIKSVESFSANSSDFGVLTSFILRQFNIIPQSVDTETGGEEKEIDISLYNEETGEEVDDSKDDAKQKKTKKNLKSEEDRRNAKYYRNKVKKLSRRYIEYLDVLTKGDKEKNIDPPSVLSINELSKFNLMATIINYYAGKTIGDEEIFYMDGDSDDSYWGLMTTIIWKCFCYTNEGEDHYPVIRKVMFDKIYSEIPIDFHFTVTMAAFSICVLIEFFRKDEDLRKLQIAAYRLYYNTGLDTKTYSAIDINDAFSKYYSKAGFFDYRNIREEKYLHFDKIYAQHEIIADRMKNIRKQLQGIQKRYDDNIGNHPRVRKGSYIWTPKTGLSYVVDVHGSSLVVFDWGLESGMGDEIKYMQGYVIEIKIDDK
jgi:ribosome recycling factor